MRHGVVVRILYNETLGIKKITMKPVRRIIPKINEKPTVGILVECGSE